MGNKLHKEFQRTEKGLGAGQNDYRYIAWLELRVIKQAASITQLKRVIASTFNVPEIEADNVPEIEAELYLRNSTLIK